MFDHIKITCPCCKKSFNFYFEDFIVDTDVDDNRGMGSETEYVIECEDYECSHCSRTLLISGSIWEYPVGVLNDSELQIIPAFDDDDDDD